MMDLSYLDQILAEPFCYSDDEWAPVAAAIIAARGRATHEVRKNLEYRIDFFLNAPTMKESGAELNGSRKQIDAFKNASADVRVLLPETARRQLERMIALLEAEYDEDFATGMGAREKTLGHVLCQLWGYDLIGGLSKSTKSVEGATPWNTKYVRRGPLVRFLIAASAPVSGHEIDDKGAENAIKACDRLVMQGRWPPFPGKNP